MRKVCLLIAVSVLVSFATPAGAIKPFYDEFKKEVLDNLKDKKAAEAFVKDDVKCFICHQGKSKKNRNMFGKEIAKLLHKKDQKDTKKMDAAFKKVLAMHVDPKNEKSDTFMDRLQAGKWPGGDLAELKKEPAKDAKDGGEKKE